jgi:hypothetical protein
MPSASPYELSGKGFLLDEYFEQQDARFVARLRACHEDSYLAGLATRMIQGSKN